MSDILTDDNGTGIWESQRLSAQLRICITCQIGAEHVRLLISATERSLAIICFCFFERSNQVCCSFFVCASACSPTHAIPGVPGKQLVLQ